MGPRGGTSNRHTNSPSPCPQNATAVRGKCSATSTPDFFAPLPPLGGVRPRPTLAAPAMHAPAEQPPPRRAHHARRTLSRAFHSLPPQPDRPHRPPRSRPSDVAPAPGTRPPPQLTPFRHTRPRQSRPLHRPPHEATHQGSPLPRPHTPLRPPLSSPLWPAAHRPPPPQPPLPSRANQAPASSPCHPPPRPANLHPPPLRAPAQDPHRPWARAASTIRTTAGRTTTRCGEFCSRTNRGGLPLRHLAVALLSPTRRNRPHPPPRPTPPIVSPP